MTSVIDMETNTINLTFLRVVAVACGTVAAIVSIPDDPQPSEALFWPALWSTVGLLMPLIFGLRSNTAALIRTEYVLMIGLVFWLLLDPLQAAYPLDGITYDGVVLAFTSIGAIAAGIWIGLAGSGWSLPKLVVRSVERQLSNTSLCWAILLSFALGMFYFAYSSGFDPLRMIEGLGMDRFSAPWSRSSFGGAEAFVEHLKYFGYVLPALTVLVAHRKGWLSPTSMAGTVMSIIMIAFLAQDGGRRTIGVMVGAALLSWVLLQERIRLKVF